MEMFLAVIAWVVWKLSQYEVVVQADDTIVMLPHDLPPSFLL